MIDEQVEKVARALEAVQEEYALECSVYIAMDFQRLARAAIAAMGDGWQDISPELIDKLNKLATYLTEQGEYEACDLIDTVVERLTPLAGEKP